MEKHTLNYLTRKIDKTGSADRASASGRRCSAQTHKSIQVVEELICSQEGQPIQAKGGHIFGIVWSKTLFSCL